MSGNTPERAASLPEKPQRMRSTAYALVFAFSLPTLQKVAREHGYALGVHGSMATDLDLIACPWTEDATSAEDLAEALRHCIGGHTRLELGQPIDHSPAPKPHGRQAYTFYVNKTEDEKPTSYGPYLDLSIMPRWEVATPAPVAGGGEAEGGQSDGDALVAVRAAQEKETPT